MKFTENIPFLCQVQNKRISTPRSCGAIAEDRTQNTAAMIGRGVSLRKKKRLG